MKKLLYLVILLGISGNYKAQYKETKFGSVDDFALHVYAGAATNIGVSTAVYAKTKRIGLACVTGFLSGIFVGGAKEMMYDKMMQRGTTSLKDFLATTWGTSIAFPIVRSGIDIHERRKVQKEYFEFLADSLHKTHLNPKDSLISLNIQ